MEIPQNQGRGRCPCDRYSNLKSYCYILNSLTKFFNWDY
jgi:hypothetical protein